MKRTTIKLAAILLLASATQAQAQAQTQAQTQDTESQWPAEPWRSKTPTELGREIPRTQTICYDSESAALGRSYDASQYLQPLGDGWETTISGDGLTATYRHSFKHPFAWVDRQLLFYLGSANAPYEVKVNGARAGYNQSAGTAAEFNITKFANEGMNTLEITVHGDALARVLSENKPSFKPELTGGAYILAQPRVRVRDYVARTIVEGNEAIIELGVILKSELLNPKEMTLHYTLLSPSGETVSSGRRDREIEMRQEDTVYFVPRVPDAKLWSPEEPNLYTLLLKTQNEGRYWEYVTYKFGIRTVGVENGELLVNGRTFPFRIAEYKTESRSATLAAMPGLKTQGVNLIAVAAPQPQWFYELCDEKGFFVFNTAEIDTRQSGDSRQAGGTPANDPQWLPAYTDRTGTMFYTSCNHPSVIGFTLADSPGNGYNLYETYLYAKQILVQRGDGRPVIFDKAGGEWNTDGISPGTAISKPGTIAGRFILSADDSAAKAIVFGERNVRDGIFTVTNNLSFRTLSLSVSYVVRQGNSRISRGEIPVVLGAGAETMITVPYGRAKTGGKPPEVELSGTIQHFGETSVQIYSKTFQVQY